MSSKEIPAKVIHTCDFCLKQVEETSSKRTLADRPKHWAKFSIYRTAYDIMDNPAADGSFHADACNECHYKLEELINEFAEHMKSAA